ncbi:Mu transposase C-terminal domain-containing protein [Pseudomonas sp. W5-01]|uniref:Mu transposase C-terminal domain-containing protein n=1 Tax=Pseudomonas sp. W5-01 TaxID=3097454 RepID=UPI0039787C11
MPTELVEGLQVIAAGKAAVVTRALGGEHVEVVLVSTSKTVVVRLSDIEYLKPTNRHNVVPLGTVMPLDVPDQEMKEACRRFEILEKLRSGEFDFTEASLELGVAKSHLYKLQKNFDKELGPIGLVRRLRGAKRGVSRLPELAQFEITKSIAKFQNEESIPLSTVWNDVQIACMEKGIASPCQRTVLRRIKATLTARQVTRLREGKAVATQKHAARPGKRKTERPLELVQMDHTLADIILLANDRVHIIGRPWLTVVIDVNTRVLLGYYLSLHSPSAVSVASAMSHAVLMKNDFLERLDLAKYSYPFFGVPALVYMDNAGEFTSAKFLSALIQAQIAYDHRPLGAKHYGGHVERYIGTMMNKVHLLSGTTMSDSRARKDLSKCAAPTMTFREFSRWFCLQVFEYHNKVHSGLGKSPTEAWNSYFKPEGITPYPPIVTDPHQFRLQFMPADTRDVHPYGIQFKGRFYWDPILEPYIGTKKAVFKYDPFSLSQIWLRVDSSYIPVPFSDLSEPDYTLEEYRASLCFSGRKIPGKFTDLAVVDSYREAEGILGESKKLTARSKAHKEEYHLAHPSPNVPAENVSNVDYTRPPTPFNGGKSHGS